MGSRGKDKLAWLAACAVFALAIPGLWIYRRLQLAPVLAAGDTVVLSSSNETGDPVFDEALYMSSLIALRQTPYINVLSGYKVSGKYADQDLPIYREAKTEYSQLQHGATKVQ
jgi:hypothetical protein